MRLLKNRLAALSVVWMMISRIPLPRAMLPREAMLPSADAMALIPLAGALLGLCAAIPAAALAALLPPTPAAWIATAIYVAFGWSFHLDGWGDLWDGWGSGKRGEAMRAVMKDSRTGAFGVAGIVIAIGTRASLLSAIPPERWLPAVVAACCLGRFAPAVAARLGEYPWPSGMGRNFVAEFRTEHLVTAFLCTAVAFLLGALAWLFAIAIVVACAAALTQWSNRTLGGTNGDVLGASAVLGELIALACWCR